MDEQDDLVNVVDPSGKLGSLPKSQANIAVTKYNYKLASADDVNEFKLKQEYSNHPIKAAGLGALGSATFGVGRYALAKSGLVPSEEQAALAKYNPEATTTGEVAGVVGPLLLGPAGAAGKALVAGDLLNPVAAIAKVGTRAAETATPMIESLTGLIANPETSAIANKILSKTASTAIGSAVEGAAFGLGQSVNEAALGDPDVNAERILSNIGYGGLLGGVLGAGFGALEGSYSGVKSKFFTKHLQQQAARDGIAEAASQVSGESINPSNLDEIGQLVQQGRMMGFKEELPSKQLLKEAMEISGPKQFPIHRVQLESLDNPYFNDVYKAVKESGSKTGQDLKELESLQKMELQRDNNKLIESLSPGKTVTADPVEGGQKLIDSFTKRYAQKQDELKPFFKEFDSLKTNTAADSEAILSHLDKSLPGVNSYIRRTEEGAYALKPYDATISGIGKETYKDLKTVVQAMNKEELTLGGLRSLRENIGENLNFLTNPKIATEVGSLRKGLMDIYQDGIQAANPSLEVRAMFKDWAINEQEKGTIERLLGGKLSDKVEFAKQIKREDVLGKIFGNTNAVKAAKQLLGSDFNQGLANYVKSNIEKYTDRGRNGFSSQQFSKFLKGKSPELREAFGDNQQILDKLNAHTDIMRILPDSPPINPSGTAKTTDLLQRLHDIGSLVGYISHPIGGLGKLAKVAYDRFKGDPNEAILNDLLAGGRSQREINYSTLSNIERAAQKSTNQIESISKKLFKFKDTDVKPIAGFVGAKLTPESKKEKKKHHLQTAKMINELYSSPEKMMAKLEEATAGIYNAAPNLTASIHMATVRATQFLASKLPNDEAPGILSSKPILSEAEISKFERYSSTIENPMGVLLSVKNGTLCSEHMDALINVYPKLYGQMQQSVMSHLTNFIGKNGADKIPYKSKMSLSMFLGQDLIDSLEQPNIASNQAVIRGNGQQQVQNRVDQKAKMSQTGLSKLNLAESAMTSMQQVSNRDMES